MKPSRIITLITALALPGPAVYASIETARGGAARRFTGAPAQAGKALMAGNTGPREEIPGGSREPEREQIEPYPMPESPRQEPLLQVPGIVEMPLEQSVGRLLGSFRMAERLDSHRDLFTLQLGAKTYDMSMASDAKFEVQYMSFQRGDTLQIRRINSLRDLRGKGVVITLADATAYRFKLSINIFSPVRGSKLKIDPVNGTRGPRHRIKTGKILDRTKEESYVFKADGKEFWVQYGTDIDPETEQPADTRSLAFTHEDGLSTKLWPIPEARVTAGKPLEITLGDTRLVLVKTLGGDLRIHLPAAKAAPSAR